MLMQSHILPARPKLTSGGADALWLPYYCSRSCEACTEWTTLIHIFHLFFPSPILPSTTPSILSLLFIYFSLLHTWKAELKMSKITSRHSPWVRFLCLRVTKQQQQTKESMKQITTDMPAEEKVAHICRQISSSWTDQE